MNLQGEVLACVLNNGIITIDQVIARVGRDISASQAAAAGRRIRACQRREATKKGLRQGTKRSTAVDIGRRQLIASALCHLCKSGKIRRVSKGCYAPPLPKLYKAS